MHEGADDRKKGDIGVHVWSRVLPHAATNHVYYTPCVAVVYHGGFKSSGSGSVRVFSPLSEY